MINEEYKKTYDDLCNIIQNLKKMNNPIAENIILHLRPAHQHLEDIVFN